MSHVFVHQDEVINEYLRIKRYDQQAELRYQEQIQKKGLSERLLEDKSRPLNLRSNPLVKLRNLNR